MCSESCQDGNWRPPPKISLKHEWERELGSDHVQRGNMGRLEVVNRTNSKFNSWENGETRHHASRDHCARWKNNVSFSGNWCSSTFIWRQKNLNFEHAYERARRFVGVINTGNVQSSSQTRSFHGSEHFVRGMERPVFDHDKISHGQ